MITVYRAIYFIWQPCYCPSPSAAKRHPNHCASDVPCRRWLSLLDLLCKYCRMAKLTAIIAIISNNKSTELVLSYRLEISQWPANAFMSSAICLWASVIFYYTVLSWFISSVRSALSVEVYSFLYNWSLSCIFCSAYCILSCRVAESAFAYSNAAGTSAGSWLSIFCSCASFY